MSLFISIIMLFVTSTTLLFEKQASTLKIENTWIRTANTGMSSAGYCEIKNTGSKDDQLLSVSCNFAKIVQIHETFQDGKNMGMRKAGDIIIKSKSTFSFKPGSYHIMFIKVKENLKAGENKELTFEFKNKGKVKVKAEVKADQ